MTKIVVFDSVKEDIASLKNIIHETFPKAKVMTFDSGEKIIANILKEKPDLIFLEFELPETDILKTHSEIRTNDLIRSTPVLFLAKKGTKKTILASAANSEIDRLVIKPIDKVLLVSCIKSVLRIGNENKAEDSSKLKVNPDPEKITTKGKIAGKLDVTKEKEEIYLAVFQNIPEIILITTLKDGVIIEANDSIFTIAGYDKNEIIGKSTIQLKFWADIKDRDTIIEQLRKTGQVKNFETRFRKKSGEVFTGLISGDLFRLRGEDVVLSVVNDITERKDVERLIQSSEEKYRTIHEDASVGLYRSSLEGRYLSVNPALASTFGYSFPEEMIEKVNNIGKEQYVNPEEREVFIDTLKKHGRIENYPIEVYRKDRKIIWISVNAHFVRDKNNAIQYIEGSMLDITARKTAEEELRKSEEKYRLLVETMPDGIYRSTPAGRFVDFNPALVEMLGYSSREELLAVDIKTQLYFDEADRESSILEEEMEEQAIYPLRKKDGSRIWVEDHGWLIKDNKGNTLFHEGILRDVTHRVHMEEQLRQSEELYRTLSNASPEANVMFDNSGQILEVSDITPGVLSYKNKSDLIGKSFLQFIPPSEVERVKELIRESRTDGTVKNFEVQIIRSDNSSLMAEVSLASIQKDHEEKRLYLVIFRDISEKKNMEIQFIQNARLVSLGEMATSIAHEINQPLHIISMSLDNIFNEIKSKKPIDEDYMRGKSEKIFNNIERIRHIIDHVRAFSRDHDDYETSLFDIHESIGNAVSMVSEQLKHKAISLSVETDKAIKPLNGNVYKFEQVIINLLGNAKDAVEERKEITLIEYKMEIGIRTFQKGDFIFMEIKDNGIGIVAENIERVLLPFYTTKVVGKGTGLGLAICYRIIQEMNGTIEIDSKRYEGTTFRVKLPVVNDQE